MPIRGAFYHAAGIAHNNTGCDLHFHIQSNNHCNARANSDFYAHPTDRDSNIGK
jgi:hypothetical protein